MKSLIGRREARKAKKAFDAYRRSSEQTKAAIGKMMQEHRAMGTAWLAGIEELDPAEAALVPAGVRESCEAIIVRSADCELSMGDTLAAVTSVHEALLKIEMEQ